VAQKLASIATCPAASSAAQQTRFVALVLLHILTDVRHYTADVTVYSIGTVLQPAQIWTACSWCASGAACTWFDAYAAAHDCNHDMNGQPTVGDPAAILEDPALNPTEILEAFRKAAECVARVE
jgi:hypothetical protein